MSSTRNLPNVVSLGGGSGLSCLLKGLKYAVADAPPLGRNRVMPWIAKLTAVVTVTDDGGSSGRLRDELQVLPPGDIRNCLVALSTDESLLSRLFQYRFPGSGDLKGHSFGNLLLTALTGVTGDFLKAIRLSSQVLAIRGQIYPSTLQDVRLEAELHDGKRVRGESAISGTSSPIRRLRLSPRNCRPVGAVLQAIRAADIITVGPGSLFTSLLPNLLVARIADAIRNSTALRIYICNLMTQPGETNGFNASHHLESIYEHTKPPLFDAIILNSTRADSGRLALYRKKDSVPVVSDRTKLRKMGIAIYERELLSQTKVVRHDPKLLAAAVYDAYELWKTFDGKPNLKIVSA